jgi:hypothetical protein
MIHRSDTNRRAARRCSIWIMLLLGVACSPQMLHSQYQKWSIAASIGYNRLNLDAVDEKNQSDVEGWINQGIPVGRFASVKRSPFYSAGVSYRYDREIAISLTASHWSKTVSSSYDGPDAALQLDRGVGSTDVVLGIAYYPPTHPYFFEWYIQTSLGLAMAHASARAIGSSMQKIGSVLTPVRFVDTDGTSAKSKISVGLSMGANIRLFGGFSLTMAAGYRLAQLGILEGDVTRFGQHSNEPTTIEFDYSGVLVSAGLLFEL